MLAGPNILIAYAAGALTILSPCVLPLVPVVLGSAGQRHKWGPAALIAGLVVSFTVTGLAVATLGRAVAINDEAVRLVGAIILFVLGLALLVPAFGQLAGRATSPLATWAQSKQSRLENAGTVGQAAIGGLLGLIWSPCVGPTLGAATVLAAQGKNVIGAASIMAAFGLGIATALLLVALATRSFLSRWRSSLTSTARRANRALGTIVVVVSLLIITGADHAIEGVLVAASPQWLTDLTTSI